MKVTKAGKARIDGWVHTHRPDGIGKLAMATEIPSTSLQKVRQGRPLIDPAARKRLIRVIGGKESDLFSGDTEESRAS